MDLNLIILNKNFEQVGFVDDFESFYINRKLLDYNSCTLHTLSSHLFEFEIGGYIYIYKSNNIYEITEIKVNEEEGNSNSNVVVTGKELLFKLDKKVINVVQNYQNKEIQYILRDLIEKFCINNEDEKRNIKNLRIGNTLENTELISKQITGDSISKVIFDFAKTYNIYSEITYDFDNNELYINFYKGLDRTYNQEENNYVIFSEDYENIFNVNYTLNNEDYVNYLFIAGAGEGKDRTIITLDLSKEGEELRELYIDARDLQKTDENDRPIDEETYKHMLRVRGREKAEEHKFIYDIQAEINTNANLIYKENYDLGDLCVMSLSNIQFDIRLTEINEIYENGIQRIEIALGTLKPTLKEFIKRESKK